MVSMFSTSQNRISEYFNKFGKSVFTFLELSNILIQNKLDWRLSKKIKVKKFIEELIKINKLKKIEFKFPHAQIYRYIWGETSIYKIGISLENNSYFSHHTAMYLHNLTNQVPLSIYVNIEQTPKKNIESQLKQENIDRAFSCAPRITKNITTYKGFTIFLLNGKNTGRLGVIEVETPEKEILPVTNVERTLIDITVRPVYSGGVVQVLEAYKRAREKVSINKLVSMLKRIKYTYPFHQAIGFYLDKAGYQESQINLLKEQEIKYNFYLAYQMIETEFSEKWKIFYPKGF
jgi:predicted transcriptional regulator of viral defense system